MRKSATIVLAVGSVLLLAACATRPVGPQVRVLPAPYKPFEVFQRDHYECEQWADDQIAGRAEQANNRAVGSAVIGTALGAALGAAAVAPEWARQRVLSWAPLWVSISRSMRAIACSGATTSLTRSACIRAAIRCRATRRLPLAHRPRRVMRRPPRRAI